MIMNIVTWTIIILSCYAMSYINIIHPVLWPVIAHLVRRDAGFALFCNREAGYLENFTQDLGIKIKADCGVFVICTTEFEKSSTLKTGFRILKYSLIVFKYFKSCFFL